MRRLRFGDKDETSSQRPVARKWRVSRIDIRSSLSNLRGHVVRVEFEHSARGGITDIASEADIPRASFAAEVIEAEESS